MITRDAGEASADAPEAIGEISASIERLAESLRERGETGVVTLSVMRRQSEFPDDRFAEYESTLEEIGRFLQRYAREAMRRHDSLLEPVVAGNTFVLLLAPPRAGRSLDRGDVAAVQHRIARSIDTHLARRLPRPALERYAVHVGGALARHVPEIAPARLLYAAIEEAAADAVRQRRRETRRDDLRVRRILRRELVRAVYQPVVDLRARRVVGYEALTRTTRPSFRSPDLLFKAAQRTGALWELERLCRRRALDSLPRLGPAQLLFLNIEPASIDDPELARGAFVEQLARVELTPSRLVLEITERAAVRDFARIRRALRDLRGVGYRFAMDDVGAGHAGLEAIAEIRPDFLKIDMALVRDLHLDPLKRELIATIVRFAERTNIGLVAEGVEQPGEAASLASVGVRCAQGFLFSEPGAPPREPRWPSPPEGREG